MLMKPCMPIKILLCFPPSQNQETRFDVDFFRSFAIVLNGLDNLEARRHVNRLCMAAERPLIESGTAGHLGQVRVYSCTGVCDVLVGQGACRAPPH